MTELSEKEESAQRRKRTGIFTRISRHIPHARRRSPPGTAPGTIIPDPEAARPVVSVIQYGRDFFVEQKLDSISELKDMIRDDGVCWINVDGLGDIQTVRTIGDLFQLHPLALEDVVNVHQRPKIDDYDDFLFLVAKMPISGKAFCTEQLSIFLRGNALITFQESPGGDCFDQVRERIRKAKGRIRERGSDFLCYSIVDSVIDVYFPVLESCSDQIEVLEDETVVEPNPEVISKIHSLKQDLMTIRRAVWPLREAINILLRDSGSAITDETRFYLRDCYDHTVQILELVESYREMCADLRDIYLSSVSNRMNEIMKVLTIISTIFIPLNFVAGIYGMNFDPDASSLNMPELRWHYGYPAILLFMSASAIAMLYFFRRRGWF